MFKFGRKDKSKSDEKKKERKDSKKEKKLRESISTLNDEVDDPRYSRILPQVPPKSSKSSNSALSPSLKNGSKPSAVTRGILKIRGSSKPKSSHNQSATNLDDAELLRHNTEKNREFTWRNSPDTKASHMVDRKKRESIHSITMNIAPPSGPPPASATEKVYDVNLELPSVTLPPATQTRTLVIPRQPKGDFGFNLRWAPYKDAATGLTLHAVHAEPGNSGAKSGVNVGDRIIEVNGRNVERCSREEVIMSIQQSGDPLQLKVQQIAEVSELGQRSEALVINGAPDVPPVQHNEDVTPLTNGHSEGVKEKFWLVHKGGYSSCQLIQPPTPDGRCKVKLEQGSHILEVDENDLEKVNPSKLDRCEDLSSLAYVNESSILHVLRQRYGSSLLHTMAGPSLLVVNTNSTLNIYSHKVMEMVKSCKPVELPPHVYSKAETVYQGMISSGRDQSILLCGRGGSGKTNSLKHMLGYYAHCYGGAHHLSIEERFTAALTVMESLGSCSTVGCNNASRFVHKVTLDFDHYGCIASTSFQAYLLERSRLVSVSKEESPFNIFRYMIHGADNSTKQELQIQSIKNSAVDSETAVEGWTKLNHSLKLLSVTADETKAIQQIVAAIIHLRNAGAVRGANSKVYFADPASAQTAASLLGVSMEELSRHIFISVQSNTGSHSSLRSAADDGISAGLEALEGFVTGLYTELFSAVQSLVNRSLSSVTRNCTSITLLDIPGLKESSSRSAGFDDLCFNYINERVQLLFHEKVFTECKERYMQENIEVELDEQTDHPEAMVNLLDKVPSQQYMLQGTGSGNSKVDLSLLGRDEDVDLGLLCMLDQMTLTPNSTEQQFVDKLYQVHGSTVQRCERLLTQDPSQPTKFTVNHCYGTAPVTYESAGWMKACRRHPSTEQAIKLLQSCQRASLASMFNSMTGSMTSSLTSSTSSTLHRNNSARRQIASHAGLRRRSHAMTLKYQMDSLLEMVSKTSVHFIIHLLPSLHHQLSNGTGGPVSPPSNDMVLDVPSIRLQLRGVQLLPAIRFHRQGYPEHLTFSEFISRYSLLTGENAAYSVPLMDQKAVVEEMLTAIGVDKSQYRIGLSQVFLRPDALVNLNHQREIRRSLHAVIIQKHIRRYLAQKSLTKLKLKHEAMKCIQKNMRIYRKLKDWPWWKLYTKIKPVVNVQKTEETLKVKEAELVQLKSQLEKVDSERNTYKKECARLEDEAVRFQSECVQERQVSRQTMEILEQETSGRLSLEALLSEEQAHTEECRRKILELEHENEELRQVHQNFEENHRELEDDSLVSLHKYEHMVKENELRRRQLQSEHEEELEGLQHTKHKIERQLHELMMEKEDLGLHITNLKKKVQKYSSESQDLKRQLEDSEARNSELEKKQRRFDNELQLKAGDIAGEKHMKDHLQKERDQLLTQKYTLTQEMEDITIERDGLITKLRRLELEMSELKSSGNHGDSELIQLKSVKHELERKLAESEDEIGDLQQEMHEVEMAKLKIQMEVDKLKQRHQKEMDQLERELDEVRDTQARKTRNYESRISELDDELHEALQGRREAERKLLEAKGATPLRDIEHEKELKTVIRRLRALLTDSQTQMEKLKEQANHKSQLRVMETKIEDLQSSLTAALKSKQSLEIELQQCQQQVSSASKSKMEAEDRAAKLMREKTDVENEKEDLDEEIHELLKRYQSSVSQNSVNTMKLKDQSEQISTLSEAKTKLQDELDTVNSKLIHIDSHYVPKDRVSALEFKVLEIEQKLDYEKSLRVRYENQSMKAKDSCEKLEDELSKVNSKVADEERRGRQLQNQLSRALESQEAVNRKDVEQTQTISNLTQKIELYETIIHQLQSELKSAQKRADNLQSELAQSTITDDEEEEYSTDSEDGYS